MKYLKLFEGYQTESKVAEICKKYGIENWTLNKDGLVDVNGNVSLDGNRLSKLPLKFGTVTGYLDCRFNKLTSLEGSPHTVGHYFKCQNNQLTTLESAPHTVGSFDCRDNKLTSLEGAPRLVRSYFDCENNHIRSFEGLVNIGADFYCRYNPVREIWNIIKNPHDTNWDNEFMDFFNDLDIIRGDEIAIDRLNFFLEEIGKPTVESVKGYKNIY